MSIEVVREDKGKGLEVQLRVTIPAEELDHQRTLKLKEWAHKVKLPGFRPGRVPAHEVRKRYESAAHQELLQKMIQDSLQEAIRQVDVEPVAQPTINIKSSAIGSMLEYQVNFEQYPEIKLAKFESCTVKTPITTLPEKEVTAAIEKVRQQNRQFEIVEKPAELNNELVVDFKGLINGEPFEGGSASGYKLILGQGRMLADFETPLLGKCAGDTVEFPLTFPKDYHSQHLAGQSVHFTVKIYTVASGDLPELNEKFFKHLGLNPPTQTVFEAEVKQPLQSQLDQQVRELAKRRVFDMLISKHKVQLPEVLVEETLKNLEKDHTKQHKSPPSTREQKSLLKMAQRQVSLGLIMREIMRAQAIQLDELRVESAIRALAVPYVDSSVFVKWYQEDPARMEQIRSRVLEDQVVDWVLSKVKVKDEKVAYHQVTTLLAKE